MPGRRGTAARSVSCCAPLEIQAFPRYELGTVVHGLVGRKAELAVVERFVGSLPDGPSALVIEGEAGIGKTTLWSEALREVDARGLRILQAQPAESEAMLSHVALADLVSGVFDEVKARLPAPQSRALETVLLRRHSPERVDSRTTAAGLVGVLKAIAVDGPFVVAVDDVQWLDSASGHALEFAARRLPAQAGLLLTQRSKGPEKPPLRLDRALPHERLLRIVPPPFSLGALHHLLESRLGTRLPRPKLIRILEASGGNPFFALEIARALPVGEDLYGLVDPLPVPSSLQDLLASRLPELPSAAQELVLAVSELSRPTLAKAEAALGWSVDGSDALLAAEEAGVLHSEHETLRFTHPLLASAVSRSASGSKRRALHRRLASVATDAEERARHLAVAATDPDEETASAIEDGARAAEMRGAHDAAAELFHESLRLTPPHQAEQLVQRTLGEASALHETGDLAGAAALAEKGVADSPTSASRGRALLALSFIEWDSGSVERVFEHMDEALAGAGEDRELELEVCFAWVYFTRTLDPKRALEFAERAEALLGSDADPHLVLLFDRFWAEALLGRKARLELLERGLELEAAAGPHRLTPMLWYAATDHFAAARARHELEDAWSRDRGDERMQADRLAYRAMVELRAGNWDLAEEYAERSCALIEGLDVGRAHAVALGSRSLVDAHRGRLDRARSTLLPLLEQAERTSAGTWWVERLLAILGFVEFTAGNYEAADRALVKMQAVYDAMGVVEPLLDWSEPFQIESLLALGDLERANEALTRLEERGRRFPRLWIDATLPRVRALVLAAEGESAAALSALETLDLEAASRLPFELGWGLLVKGQLLRRLKQRRLAATTLREAHGIFEQLGAPRWIERTEAELARVGPRRRAADELTATELRVAELAAAGLTNHEVAKAAFVTTKTVEANLARVYRKLGIHSRAELGARIAARPGPDETRT
jgi:DNA-binding CsgD family transcriptional regulator